MTNIAIEYLEQINHIECEWPERYALNKIYHIFQRHDMYDAQGFKLISRPQALLSVLRADYMVVDNIDEIAFKLELDIKNHLERIANNYGSCFTGVRDWLQNHGWSSNEFRKANWRASTRYFPLAKKQRGKVHKHISNLYKSLCIESSQVLKQPTDKRREQELQLKHQNAEKHKLMCEKARLRRYEE